MVHGTVFVLIQYIVIHISFGFEEKKGYLIFPTMKGSVNACMELVGFDFSKKVKNY